MNRKVTNWNNFPQRDANLIKWQGSEQLTEGRNYIARGMGRCYGDAALSDNIVSMLEQNLFIEFDRQKGILECQAGVTLSEILEVIVPAGWFLPVTPGTKFITVGGALASDVHGKNHHVDGCFGDHVTSFQLQTPQGDLITCTEELTPELFHATRGGMGLTGIITTVRFNLKKIETSYISKQQIKARDLSEIIALFDQYKSYTYSMAWIDCLKGGKGFGRSLMMMGEHATPDELNASQKKSVLTTGSGKKINMPFNLPGFALNPLSIKAFNFLYYNKQRSRELKSVDHYDGFFYPLDAILHWNRMYGKRGFIQYQFVLPIEESEKGLRVILESIRKKGWGSFLAVLKLFGNQPSYISFPMEGYTLALDFPMKKGLLPFLDELDKIVHDLGGRIYLSKDARMKPERFLQGYANSSPFLEFISELNPEGKFGSDLSKRLSITS
ncbi:FAD-binding oxidoreductase [Fulvivirga sp. M361]|uniref:FAD-binding oxidoreductase n=1 Tax=Fulvivirga sp. M361 TaxID=2594266 RepID=UPI001179A2C8|nr:FAD-binding oxidoreductase [Fulvivirga sp. M361]TRX60100.1 FAD-binding oxidoreductase [Fulvivirga sp. M361]